MKVNDRSAMSEKPTAGAMEVVLAQPRGFCAGVDRAIEIVERALAVHGAPIYVRHEIVHNKYVVDDLRAKGAVFVDELEQVPTGAIVVFSAHGVSKAVRATSSTVAAVVSADSTVAWGMPIDSRVGRTARPIGTCAEFHSPASPRMLIRINIGI